VTLVAEIARVSVGVVFALASVSKLRAPADFARTVASFGIPGRVAPAVAVLVIGVELALAVLLTSGVATRPASVLAVGVLGGFAAFLTWNRLRTDPRACNCFGASDGTPHPTRALLRGLLLLGAAAMSATDAWEHDAPSLTLELALGGIGIVLLGYWLLHLDEVVRLVRTPHPAADRPRRVSYKGAPLLPLAQITGTGPAADNL
jgi:uncharacterized membrane protein YphA (DoxX/SURF4 family)